MIDHILLTKKLEELRDYLNDLKNLAAMDTKEILSDPFKYHTAERIFQLVVDVSVDINIHIIREKGVSAPDDLQSTFVALGKIDILPNDLAVKIAPVVGLRNRIVHRYDTLDKSAFVELLKKNLPDFDQYFRSVSIFVKKLD